MQEVITSQRGAPDDSTGPAAKHRITSNLPALGAELDIAALVKAEVARETETLRAELDRRLETLRERLPEDRATLVVFSGDLDKVLAAFIIATGAAAMGLETSMFFTFWGLSAIRKEGAKREPKDIYERLFGLMTPSSSVKLDTSKMSFFGAGAAMLRRAMQKKEVTSLEDLIALAREAGVTFTACTMSMDVMGIGQAELHDGVTLGGVATYLGDAARSRVTLFI